MMNRKMVLLTIRYCSPCKMVKKTLVPEVEADCPGQVQVVDAEDDLDNLARKNKVTRVPTILLMEDGNTVKVYSGVLPQPGVIVNWLKGGELHGADRRDG